MLSPDSSLMSEQNSVLWESLVKVILSLKVKTSDNMDYQTHVSNVYV